MTVEREGYVTNSSSSHQIVRGAKKAKGEDYIKGEYGWGWFVLRTPEEKMHYMAVVLAENLAYGQKLDEDQAVEKTNELFGYQILDPNSDDYFYIDHASRISLPRKPDDPEGWVYMKFFWDLFDHIVFDPNVVIAGGNDNEEPPAHFVVSGGTIDATNKLQDLSRVIVEKGETPGHWRLTYNSSWHVDKYEPRQFDLVLNKMEVDREAAFSHLKRLSGKPRHKNDNGGDVTGRVPAKQGKRK